MFKTLFHYPRVISRHANAPLAQERSTFLSHLASRGTPLSTLLRYARQLRVIAITLGHQGRGLFTRQAIRRSARWWAQRQQELGRAHSLKWPKEHFHQVACAWYAFMGRLKPPPLPPIPHAAELEAWRSCLRSEALLAEGTITDYCWWTKRFLQWLQEERRPLRGLTLASVDRFTQQLAAKGLSRVSLAKAATVLRRFLRYAFERGRCRRYLSAGILGPRIFRDESLPIGPAWSEVQRLLAANQGSSPRALRNRAILWLLSVYGLRGGEVRGLCLGDLDWTRRIVRVHRTKTARVQEYPLTPSLERFLQEYLKEGRPQSPRPEVFLTLQAPFRPLSGSALYDLTRSLMERLGIVSVKRGPHALRHACATYLPSHGFRLKQVGDHVIMDCDSGICLGNSSARDENRRHANGMLVRNNFIVRCPEVGILADHTRACRIVNNTVFDPDSRLGRLIRVLDASDGLVVASTAAICTAMFSSASFKPMVPSNSRMELKRLCPGRNRGCLVSFQTMQTTSRLVSCSIRIIWMPFSQFRLARTSLWLELSQLPGVSDAGCPGGSGTERIDRRTGGCSASSLKRVAEKGTPCCPG
jgi:site-specific recombinase XerD